MVNVPFRWSRTAGCPWLKKDAGEQKEAREEEPVRAAMRSSENREYEPSCLYPFAVLASQCCQRRGFAEAANDARLRGKWPASMETQTKDEHQATGRERGANRVSTDSRKRPPRNQGKAPGLRMLASALPRTKDGRRAAETDMSSKSKIPSC